MPVLRKRRFAFLVAFVAIHATLWVATSYVTNELAGALLFFSLLPWLPLAWAGIATTAGLVPLPNTMGIIWCVSIWLVVYWFLAGILVRLTSQSTRTR
jgi:hypothetical protein